MHSKGLIVGKFMPIHTGHIALIDFALKNCDLLQILVCTTQKEEIAGQLRYDWIKEIYKNIPRVSIIHLKYNEEELPNTSISSVEVSRIWANYLLKRFPETTIIFSSEEYGKFLANFMGIQHLVFDKERIQFNISATLIRENPLGYWDYIPPIARPYFTKKICIVGSESTGKSTLTKNLAAHFNTVFVREMARDIIEKTTDVTYVHLLEIALLHAKAINEMVLSANKFLFIDTDITITKSYSSYLFDKELNIEPWIEEANKADLYIFLETDCAFIQDGTRLMEEERNKLSNFHKREFEKQKIDYIVVGGDWKNRFNQSCDLINKVFLQ